ncbi:MAG: capsule assembly Wzi family protein [Candidatus Mcinerneyibacterium aminivorans]|uniref:Capsule assembly Wzi family protein n=1 Tax=Candidatus Mcinerneyibacterium aminivorans TaxID=2703815 RepID=A0A5D0MGG6_9BACT|nr:MAG: capsule assembly Wzi family protein [Candidatus Mcinerneyibacterium aminivorans]
MKKLLFLFIIGLMVLSYIYSFEQTDSEFYDFVEDIYIKYGLKDFSYTRPYNRKEIVEVLNNINKNKDNLTEIEKNILKRYRKKYSSYIEDNNKKEYHLYSYERDEGNLYLDFVGKTGYVKNQYDLQTEKKLNYLIYTGGITFKGNVTDYMDYYFYFRDETYNLEEKLSDVRGYFENRGRGWIASGFRVDKKEIYMDTTETYLDFYLPYTDIRIGKNNNSWGPGNKSNVMISDNATSYVQFYDEIEIGKFQLSSFTGGLRTYLMDPNTTIELENGDTKQQYRKKYIAAHRLEISVLDNLKVGINESVIYADKNLQLGYMIPFNFFWSEQHYEGDRDNSTMGADVSFVPFRGVNLYGEIFIDDLSVSELSDYKHSKFAYLGGINYYPHFVNDIKLILEYSRVNPIVYTHRFNVDNFTHYRSNIGSFLYPNSDYLYAGINKNWTSKLQTEIYYFKKRHGDNYTDQSDEFVNVGGDMYTPHALSSESNIKENLNFLDGIKETTRKIGINLKYLIEWKNIYKSFSINNLFLKVNYELSQYEQKLPDNIKTDSADRIDENLNSFEVLVEYNY